MSSQIKGSVNSWIPIINIIAISGFAGIGYAKFVGFQIIAFFFTGTLGMYLYVMFFHQKRTSKRSSTRRNK